MNEGAEEREAQLAKFRGAAPGLSERLAGERADAIPAEAVEAAAKARFLAGYPPVSQKGAHEVWKQLDPTIRRYHLEDAKRDLAAALPFLRAAHPEAGNEEGELRQRVEDEAASAGHFMAQRDEAAADVERLREDLLRIRTAAQCNMPESVVAFVLKITDPSAHPEADRAPENER